MRVPKIEIMSARIVNETVIKSKICFNFIKARISQRFDFVKANGLCLLCLRSGHSVKICKVARCRLCELPHHVLLHNEDLVQKHKNSQWYQDTNSRSLERGSMSVAV